MIVRKKNDPATSYLDKKPFNLTARRINTEERKKYQVFLSHSNTDGAKLLEEVAAALTAKGVNIAYDRAFLSGGENFQKVIEDNIHCYAGVVLVTPALLRSGWCNYEIGFFAGKEMNVYLYDPEDLIAGEGSHGLQYLSYHLHSYLPAYKTLDALVKAVSEASVYSGMFTNETASFTKKDFTAALAERVDTSVIRISSPSFETDRDAFVGCRFGTLVVHFGTFKTTVARGTPCYAVEGKQACFCSDTDVCAVQPIKAITERNMECVLLNHVLDNGTLFLGDTVSLEFHLPVHKRFGTEFKFIVDVPSNDKLYRLMSVFEAAGMNPTLSDSCNGGRIYLALPERASQGIFNIRGDFNNNFACPKALSGRA